MTAAKTDRNLGIVQAYLAGNTWAEIGASFGVSSGTIMRVVTRAGAKRTPEERSANFSRLSRIINARPDVKASKSVKMRAHYLAGRVGSRPKIFANDPARRDEYLTLRDCYGAAYAREAMGLAA